MPHFTEKNDNRMIQGYLFDIQRYSIHNGPGIRVTLFLQGCPLKCWWCHNPEGIRVLPSEGEPVHSQGTSGRKITLAKAIEEIEKDILFFDESNGGVTFSGGEPLVQHEFLREMLITCKKRDIHTVVDTSGYASPEIFKSIITYTDIFLYDIKLMDEQEHEKFTGVSNRLILENLQMLSESGRPVLIRFPLIPQITDTGENLSRMADYLLSLKKIHTIHVLPFHKTAQRKYERLQIEDKLNSIAIPSVDRVNYVKTYFEQKGFLVHIGG